MLAGLTAKVAADYPGRGRRVYPSVLQLLAYGMASPGLYAEVQRGLLHELAFGRAGEFDRQHADIHSLLDVPSELFMHMLAWTLDRAPWRRGMPVLAGTGYDLLAYSGSRRDGEGWERRSLSRLSGTLIDAAIIVTPTVVNVVSEVPIVGPCAARSCSLVARAC